MLEVYRGAVNAWECDDMGHMNVRFYVAKMMEGLAGFAHAVGMTQAFAKDAPATIVPVAQHIRFHREARAGQPLVMQCAAIAATETEAQLIFLLDHAPTGAAAASFVTRVRHVSTSEGKTFPWSKRALAGLNACRTELPAHAAPRGLDPETPLAPANRANADAWAMAVTGRGVVDVAQCDVFGRMKPEFVLGRISDSVPTLMDPLRRQAEEQRAVTEGRRVRHGGAVTEALIRYRKWPRAGDGLEIRTGLATMTAKAQTMVHWLLDPVTGDAWASGAAVAVNFDLDTRTAFEQPPAIRALLAPMVRADLSA